MATQTGTITSYASWYWSGSNTIWNLQYEYTLDAGGTAVASVAVGTGPNADVAPWSSADSTISVTPEGVADPVLLPCPPVIQYALFGVKSENVPYTAG